MAEKVVLKVYVEPWLKHALSRLAEMNGKNMSEYVAGLLESWVRRGEVEV